jgi:short-subunit dehydrogenase
MARTAVITGASSGIGREIARILYAKGFRCILCARREDRLKELAQELGENTRVVVCDLSKREECFSLYEQVKDEKIGVLINGAGFGLFGRFTDTDTERELDMIDTNVTAVHILMKLFLKDFTARGSGYIMNIASSAGLMSGGPYMSTYYATKAYVADLTSAVASELEEQGSRVKVCALCPGPVDTEFNDVAGCSFGVKAISAKQCSDEAVKGMFAGKTIIVPSATLKLAAVGAKLLPRKMLVTMTGRVQKGKGEL